MTLLKSLAGGIPTCLSFCDCLSVGTIHHSTDRHEVGSTVDLFTPHTDSHELSSVRQQIISGVGWLSAGIQLRESQLTRISLVTSEDVDLFTEPDMPFPVVQCSTHIPWYLPKGVTIHIHRNHLNTDASSSSIHDN